MSASRQKFIYSLAVCMLLLCRAAGQYAPVNFHHLSVKNGLNDGIINAIAEDKYGSMWFASYGALNRFNGTSVKKYEHLIGDSSSAPGGIVHTLFCSSTGRLFIGGDNGLQEFNYNTGRFVSLHAFDKIRVTAIAGAGTDTLIVLGNNSLWQFNAVAGSKQPLFNQLPGKIMPAKVFSCYKQHDLLYAGVNGGYLLYNLSSKTLQQKEVPQLNGAAADAVMPDARGNIWINNVFGFRLLKIDITTDTVTEMDKHPLIVKNGIQQQFLDFVADSANVWIATSLKGLIRYDVNTGAVTYYQKNLLKPGSIANNILRTIFLSKDGTVWVSMLGGIDYFHPEKNIFDAVFPFPSYDANQFARGFTEDKQGNYWFSTGDGVTRLNKQNGQYAIWQNETGKPPVVYYNSARAVLADGDAVWIATGKGINRYNINSGKMEFLTAKDSLPEIFYLNINKDSRGTIWFCSNMKDGLYYRDAVSKKIHSICNHPVLKRFCGYGVRRVFEDSKKRLWLGFAGQGYAVYDPAASTVKYWYNTAGADSSFNSNLVIDIAEDKKGVVWLTTFNGVRGEDMSRNTSYWLTVKTGLHSNVTNAIRCDGYNRLWIGTSAGLVLVDSSRKNVYHFDESYGFPSMEFPEHQAHETSNGYFIFPSNKGYIKFNPAALSPGINQLPFFIEAISVLNRRYDTLVNYKELETLSLRHDENFFTITLEALNYTNPQQTWYAYKLDGLDNDWHYTQDPKAVYTSVPGGDYIFRYRAGAGAYNSSIPEKTLAVHIAKVFYKTVWFWLAVILVCLCLLYLLYRYRLRQQQQLFLLQGKAQQLEKEKAQVMYDSLKQQLNPHFLFNSLTSLSGLIETDQGMAGSFLKQMSKIYRYILKNRDSELVKLKEELEFAQTYISLQQTRFKAGLEVQIKVDDDALHKKIPPVTLQNMIENAIKHNVIDADTPLQIRITNQSGYLVITNNLQKKQMVESSNRQGLQSLQSLYSYLTDRPLVIEETADEFIIKLPLI